MERSVDILNELNEISPVVAGVGNKNVFLVPEGYFDATAGVILNRVKDVPEGYFDNLSTNILSKIEGTVAHELQELSPFMAGLKKVTPYEVPADYFQSATADTLHLVTENNMPAILNGVNTIQPFKVPAGYFDQLPGTILDKIKEEKGAKVVAMPKRGVSVFKYAAAAVFTGMISFGVYKYTGTSTSEITTAPVVLNEKEFNDKMNNLSEEDIIKYLEKNGSETDVAMLTSNLEEGTLPKQEDYFTDEETLDKFLEDIEQKN